MHISENDGFELSDVPMYRLPTSRFACAIRVKKWMDGMPVKMEHSRTENEDQYDEHGRPWFVRFSSENSEY